MKTEIIFIQGLNREIMFHIGQNKNDNFNVIDYGQPDDIWFHANEVSSCHIVANIPNGLSNKEKNYIIKTGALLCKKNTNKLKNLNNVEITYTKVKYIEKTQNSGCVKIINEKKIKI